MIKRLFLFIISLTFILSCKGPQVVSFINPRIDFGNFNTYRIVSPVDGDKQNNYDSSSVYSEIENLIDIEMQSRHYKHHPKSDLRVQYSFIANNKTDIDITPNYYYRNSVYSPYSYPYNSYQVRQRNFYEAILLVEIKDRSAKIIWQGSLDLRYTKKVKDKDDILPLAVLRIFETYPYVADSNQPVTRPDN